MICKMRRALPLLIIVLFVGTAWAEEAPELPKDVNALPADLASRMKGLIKQAEKYRGLNCKHAVPCGAVGKEGLRKKMLQAFDEELPAEKMNPLEASLKSFGFIPETMVLNKYYPELLTSQVAGFYDPRRKYLAMVENGGGVMGKAGKEQYGADLAERMDDTVMVHELTHALQDQYFDLQKFSIDAPMSDAGAARTALIEGDATLTMYDFFSGMQLENMPGVEQMMNKLFEDPKQLMDMAPDMPGSKEMGEAPAWFRDNLLFSYMNGFTFCINIKKLGGQKLLDYAFTKDPPKSTEQILHPEKWHGQRDDPIEIAWPDLSAELPGYAKIYEAQLGEQSIKVLLRDKLKDDKNATTAAAGWGGDRFAVYAKGNDRLLLWITEWDSNQDSKEFKEIAAKLGEDWKIESPRPSRVVIIRGKTDGIALDALKTKLADAKATAPDNKAMDFAALGIKKGAAPAGGNDLAEALAGLLGEDEKNGGKELDIGALLKDPNIQKIADNLGKELGGGEGGLDIGKMMKDPAMQELMKNMLSQERPAGKLSDDRRSYTNAQIGLEIALPESLKDWKFEVKPPQMISALAQSPLGGQISLVTQSLPIATPIETMGPMMEMGPKMMEGYKKISGGLIETSGKKGYELQFEASNGAKLHMIQRAYVSGSNMIVIIGMAPVEGWPAVEKGVKEALDGLKFVAPAPAGEQKKAAPKKEPLEE
jgi:hypothetical protein